MATSKNGHKLGKLGDTTSYFLNGKLTTRTIGKSNKAPSILQKIVRQKTSVISKFLNPIMEFILVGYEKESRRLAQQAQNPAFSYNWRYALTGDYPEIKIDFTKVLLTIGSMPSPEGLEVQANEEGFMFSWNLQEGRLGTHWSDQVMLMAYFPTLRKAVYLTAGSSRYKGKDLLPIFDITPGVEAETYVAFISNDRKSISNSVYSGKVNW